jgi:asparagine synthase (glutamine-hydrolysing)
MLSENTVREFGIFDPEKVQFLLRKIRNKGDISEIDQMAVAGILSTQILYKLFIRDAISTDTGSLANLRIVQEPEP